MQLIVITGASRGIGKAIAVRFAREGWNMAICSRDKADISRVSAQLSGINPSIRMLAVQADLSRAEEAKAFGKRVVSEAGVPDLLVNNAGIFFPGTIYGEKEGVLEQLISVNLYGAYHLTRTLLPSMMSAKHGHIVNICSTASLKAYPNGGSYSISKFAFSGFSRNLREELAPFGIRVTGIYPGPVFTDSWKETGIPPDRMMAPQDVAETIWAVNQLPPGTVVEEILLRPLSGDLP